MFGTLARRGRQITLCIATMAVLGGCSWFNNDRWDGQTDPDAQRRAENPYGTEGRYMDPMIFGDYRNVPAGKPRGLIDTLFAPDKDDANSGGGGGGGAGIGVNSFLWHASLDTVSFMPLASADPFGGTIITDWYSPPETPNERFKLNIFILGRDLRADGVRARVFRQAKDPGGNWADSPVDQNTGTDIENAILTRARQLRVSTVAK